MKSFAAVAGLFWLSCFAPSLSAAAGDLTAYFIDVEGGQATLFVTPLGQSVLIDAGFPGPGTRDRDANRIAAAATEAGVKQIDYLIVTHYHDDHVGGVPALAARLPIRNFVDHGENVETAADMTKMYADYLKEAAKGNRMAVKPGDKLPIKGLEWEIVAVGGKVLDKPMAGAGKTNALCAGVKPTVAENAENARSAGSVITLGQFRMVDLADLTWNKELEMMCPKAKLGPVDVFVVNHHGEDSNAPPLVYALHPKVAIMDNAQSRGGSPNVWDVVKKSPGLIDLWQLHYIGTGGRERNVDSKLIANVKGGDDQGNYLKLVAHRDGHFEVTNPGSELTKKY